MTIFNVNSATGLSAALKSAKGGDTIQLASGTYNGLTITNQHFTTPVTITSADPNHAAILSGLKVSTSSGLNFTNLELTTVGSTDPWYPFRISYSSNLTFSHLFVHGAIGSDPGKQLNGFYISASDHITVTNSNFEYLNGALIVNNNDFVKITNNSFSHLSKGGVEMGATSDVSISNNNFTNFQTASGVHGDVIQLYTYNTTTQAHDISITGNLYDRGAGVPAQGIFVQDETGHLPFKNVTIDNNTMLGGDWNAIDISGGTGNIEVKGNTVASWTGYDVVKGANTNFTSWIRLESLTGASVVESGNSAQAYLDGHTTIHAPAGNSVIGAVSDGGTALLQSWEASHASQLGSLSSELQSLLGLTSLHSTVGLFV